MRMILKSQNCKQKEIKSRLNSEMFAIISCLLSENMKIKVYRKISLCVVLYGFETESVT
jgi:hypothetical protein